ncbi:MAG: GGDEF domain-containing protein [Bacillus sp. (in: Bacteria)]|nr:GGDEF domain-containing protein [Bacillus sp. (in: firmicutes)]MCM1426960.1 GGDEF domain-containing protein [Eubacterium sp.]
MMMNESGTKNRIYHIVYAVMVAFFVAIIIGVAVANRGQSPVERLSEGNIAFNEGWYLEDGSAADVSHLNEIPSVAPYQEESVYHSLPDDLAEGLSLCFRSKNIDYQVYVDGELRYAPVRRESRIYNKSFGNRWNYVPLYGRDAGKIVEVRFHTVYESGRACMDNLRLGFASGEIVATFTEKTMSFSTCLFILFVGLLLLLADIPANLQMRKNHELLYLGLFSICIAFWCMAESGLLQFYTDDSRLIQLLSCCSLITVPIPLVLYLDAAFGFKKKAIVPIITGLSVAEFVICTILHFAGVKDYHETLSFSMVVLAISLFLLIYSSVTNALQEEKNKTRNVYGILRIVGFVGLGIAGAIDIVRYYKGRGKDNAMFVRIGLLAFILCYGISSLEKIINTVKLGVQSEFVSQLAYQDGLTGVGNRTAFQERLEELEKEKKELPGIAIMMFDVNDLKRINDNQGHQKGDQLIVCSAQIIKAAAESVSGVCYRIGGDEFACILSGEDMTGCCEKALSCFKKAMDEYNSVKGQPFHISIASGYAVYDKLHENETLMDVYQQADARMYENKKQIKAAR